MQRDRDRCFIQVEAAVVDRMRTMRRPDEDYSDVILRLTEIERQGRRACVAAKYATILDGLMRDRVNAVDARIGKMDAIEATRRERMRRAMLAPATQGTRLFLRCRHSGPTRSGGIGIPVVFKELG